MPKILNNSGFNILSPTAILGYGFPDASLAEGMKRKPDLIAVDAGSIDPGPYYLGSGKSFSSRSGVKRDLKRLINAQQLAQIPLIIGSAGGSGARPHLDSTLEIISEISSELGTSIRIGEIAADVTSELLKSALNTNRIRSLPNVPPLKSIDINATTHIVAQMGHEPIMSALDFGFDIILCGRCYDPAVFAALPIKVGFDPGLAIHMGKILECAAISAKPGSGSDCIMGRLFDDHFILESLSHERKFTSISVAAHSLYEKSDPYHLIGPGGILHMEGVKYENLDGGRVKVSGSRFESTKPYTVKLEGARSIGYRTISLAGIRDPSMITDIDTILNDVKTLCKDVIDINSKLIFYTYGKDGVLGLSEPIRRDPAEICLVTDIVSPDQDTADNDCALVRSTLLHFGFQGRLSTAGNLAFPFSPSDFRGGEVFQFSVYHLMELDDPLEIFPIQTREFKP